MPLTTPSGLPWRQRLAPATDTPETTEPNGQGTPSAPGAPALPSPTIVDASTATPVTSGWVTVPNQPAADDLAAPPESPTPPAAPPRPVRGLEETRNLMASYRSGTMRGRTEAARLAESKNHAPEWTPPTQESVGTEDGG
jgi:hypothetical protein